MSEANAQLALVARNVGRVRDPLGRVFTPQSLANAIVDNLPDMQVEVAVDPALGGGAFARAIRRRWPNARIIGVDIDPEAEGFADVDERIVGDWLQVAPSRSWPRVQLVATNPPYNRATGRKNDKGEDIMVGCIGEHLIATATVRADVTELLLPAATLFCGPDAEARAAFDWFPPAVATRIDGRPWPKLLREAASYRWRLRDPLPAPDTIVPRKALAPPNGRWT